MVNDADAETKIASITPFGLRLQPDLKRRVEAAAKANRRSLNSEIAVRLAESLGLNPAAYEPSHPTASETAIEALRLARDNARRLGTIEAGLRTICSADEFLDEFNDPAQRLFQDLKTRLPKE